jgi:peptide deformylase
VKTLPIYTYGFDILRKKTKRIAKIDDKLIELVQSMFYTMDKASGIGLAAPQVGFDIALTVIDVSRVEGEEDKKPLTLLNPKVVDIHGEIVIEEGCLSIPLVRAEVARPDKIFLQYQDLDLNEKTIELDGLLSRVAQHEIDHLGGVLFVDHLPKDVKKRIKEQLNNIKSGGVQTNYILAEIPKKKLTRNHILDRI